MKKKEKKMNYRKKISIITLLLIGSLVVNNIKLGYALSLNSDKIPNETFTTNYSGSGTIKNLVGQALSSYPQSLKDNFAVVQGLKDKDNTYPLYVFSKNSLVPTVKEDFEISSNIENNPAVVNDAGLKYIIRYGYNGSTNADSIFDREELKSEYGEVDDDDVDDRQYITQIALWKYIYEKSSSFTKYCSNNRCAFNGINNVEALNNVLNAAYAKNAKLKYINKLVEEAKNPPASSGDIYKISSNINKYNFEQNRKYILTDSIKLKNVNKLKFVSWKAEVLDPNNYGIYITDANGRKLTNTTKLTADKEIKLRIPLNDDLSSMNLKTSGIKLTFEVLDEDVLARDFRVTYTRDRSLVVGDNGTKEEKFSNVLMGVVKTKSSNAYYYLSNFTDIRKVDTDSGEEIAGAHLALYDADDIDEDLKPKSEATILKDSNDNNIEWVSVEGESHKLYLEDGRYGLCETMAPSGYELKTTCEIFEVNNSESITVVAMENKLTEIPNTGSFKSYLPYVLGGGSVLIGASLILYLTKKRKGNAF